MKDAAQAGKFQYMLLLRGATRGDEMRGDSGCGFNTCSSCEEQPPPPESPSNPIHVSIHAPLARSNLRRRNHPVTRYMFQYMLLLRGATTVVCTTTIARTVSIHAPLARSNSFRCASCASVIPFQYMLLLRGATVTRFAVSSGVVSFQYMLLLRGATNNDFVSNDDKLFQYMLLLRGATRSSLIS